MRGRGPQGAEGGLDMFLVTVADFSLYALHPMPHGNVKKIVIALADAVHRRGLESRAAARHARPRHVPGRQQGDRREMKHPETGKVINFFSKTGDAAGSRTTRSRRMPTSTPSPPMTSWTRRAGEGRGRASVGLRDPDPHTRGRAGGGLLRVGGGVRQQRRAARAVHGNREADRGT